MLSKKEILAAIRSREVRITPFGKECVGAVSVDLHLGSDFKVFTWPKGDIAVDEEAVLPKSHTKSITLRKGETLALKPGEFCLGVTRERVKLSENYAGTLEGRSRFARLGLMVHISSALVQPGVNNVQVLEIVNFSKGTLRLKPGTRICQIILYRLHSPAKYTGRYARQSKP